MKSFENLCTKVVNLLPEEVLGKCSEYRRYLYVIYGEADVEEEIHQMRYKICKNYITVCLCFLLLCMCFFIKDIIFYKSEVLLNEHGQQYLLRPKGENVTKYLNLKIEGVEEDFFERQVDVEIKNYEALINGKNDRTDNVKKSEEKEAMKEQNISFTIDRMIEEIENDKSKEKIILPEEIEGVGRVLWSQKRENSGVICVLCAISILVLIYSQRYDQVKKIKRKSEASIDKELPDFLNKLVLLMNAGLVLSAAFEKTVEGYDEKAKEKSYFYSQLELIKRRMEETNSPMVQELKAFAERSGNREFMRATNLMYENVNKGTKLVEALENESNFLWFQRKKKAEEKGRISETKLTLPLAMELVALIVITIMPAMLEM